MFNDKLSDLRRDLQKKAKAADQEILKGTRWLLLKNPQNFNEKNNDQQRLEAALQLNKPLATAYYLKEDMRQLWLRKDKVAAVSFLDDWILRARGSGIKMLDKFADILDRHRIGILAYYQYPISTGLLEGTNNKMKTFQKKAYGFRDVELLKLKIYALRETECVYRMNLFSKEKNNFRF